MSFIKRNKLFVSIIAGLLVIVLVIVGFSFGHKEKAKPEGGSGSFEGWADSSSVEIKMSDGDYQTFFVEKEEVKKALNEKGEGASISFTYGALEGQANKQILSMK